MVVRVVSLHDLEISIPIRWLLLLHEVELIGHRPPDVAITREAREDVTEIAIIAGRIHAIEAPMAFVIRMKQDEIRLDAETHQLRDAFFLMPEEFRVEPREIPALGRRSLEWIEWRFAAVVGVPLGEQAHAQLVEGRRFETGERL